MNRRERRHMVMAILGMSVGGACMSAGILLLMGYPWYVLIASFASGCAIARIWHMGKWHGIEYGEAD